ncbi:HTH-type transcriptional regulator CynR [Methylobacterium crusticola]|uniref:HTH-type transcriptional regulator CynR n=1 Tax=Methylobacterium crusticola TaxID=1697972 RepID=A0ABQ4R6K2_9HYPH|nr:LysR family transcriptional regulator [Methylobacterium crusticola]GJD53057.1 HTH-type transcriptional regulator CynR [Methylobacterium crusticola]
MDLRRAKTFVTVAELGTVSKAALRLRIAQPALSRQINDLEQELGLKLFDRLGRRLVLTGEGAQLLGDCRALLDHAGAVLDRARALRRGDAGVLKVAASPQLIESVVAPFLHIYAERYPAVEILLTEAIGWPEIMGLLERGEVHLGQNLLRAVEPGDGRFAHYPLAPIDLLAACHAQLGLGRDGTVEIAQLASHRLLLLDGGFIVRRTFDACCRLAGFEPHATFESRTPHTLLAMAEHGLGVAVIPSALRTRGYDLRLTGLTYRSSPLREPLALFWSRRRSLPLYATAFCEMLASYVDTVFPISRSSCD